MSERCDAILVSAGRGERLGQEVPKGRVSLGGEPLFIHSLRVLCGHPGIERVLLVVPPEREEMETTRTLLEARMGTEGNGSIELVAGGERRQDSVCAALEVLAGRGCSGDRIVLVHDSARPLLTPGLITRCLEAMLHPLTEPDQEDLPGLARSSSWGSGPAAVVPGLPVCETLKLVFENRVVLTQPRESLFAIQTPQCFRFGPLSHAHRRARRDGVHATDDAALLEWQGIPVSMIPGEAGNLKITLPGDLAIAARLLPRSRRAQGGGH